MLKKILRWVGYSILILITLLFVFIESVDWYMSSTKGTNWMFSDITRNVTINRTSSGLRYLSIGADNKPPLLLIHGAPGGYFDWKGLASKEEIYNHYRLLIVDRPGYGGTKPRGAETSIKVQVERIMEVLEKETQPVVVMGHSYGAPIAIVMGAMHPDRISKVLGISGQYDPDNEIIFKISYLGNIPPIRWLMPRLLRVSNREKLTHPNELRAILPYYNQVQAKVVLVHGNADSLVPYENSPFLMKFLNRKNKLITLEGYDHPLQMQAVDELLEILLAN